MAAFAAASLATKAMIVTTAVSTAMQIQAARQQKAIYNAQAAQARLKGRAKATEYKNQAANVMRRLNETLSTTIARASVGADPLSGSALTMNNFAISEAAGEYYTSKDNQVLALSNADAQANIYKAAGQQAMMTGYANAIGTASTGYYQALKIGT